MSSKIKTEDNVIEMKLNPMTFTIKQPTLSTSTTERPHHRTTSSLGSLSSSLHSMKRNLSIGIKTMRNTNTAHDRALQKHKDSSPHLSCRGRIVGLIRVILAFFFAQALFLGLAIAIAVVLLIAFMVTRHQRMITDGYNYRVLLWTLFTPWIMLNFALLMQVCLHMLLDLLQNSAGQSLNSHDLHRRQEFIFTIAGGESPLLLNFRGNIVAIIAAAVVPLQHRPGDLIEPLFPIHPIIILVSEIIFIIGFVIIPSVIVFFGQGIRHQYDSFIVAFLVTYLCICMIAVVLNTLMNVIIYFWPRAARIHAFITAKSIAMHAFTPYIEDISTYSVVRRLKQGSCICCNNNKHQDSDIIDVPRISFVESNDSQNSRTSNPFRDHPCRDFDRRPTDLTTGATKDNDNNNNDNDNNEHCNVMQFDEEQFCAIDSNNHNKYLSKALEDLNKVQRSSFYNRIGPRWWYVIGTPTDLIWDRCCSKIPLLYCCLHCCCENGRWDSSTVNDNTADKQTNVDTIRSSLSDGSQRRRDSISSHLSLRALQLQETLMASCKQTCNHLDYKWNFFFTFVLYLVMFSVSLVPGMYVTVQFLMAITVLMFGRSLRDVAPSIFGRTFNLLLFLQVFIQFMILLLSWTNEGSGTFANQNVTFTNWNPGNNNSNNITINGWPAPHHKMLPICDARWGAHNEVSILDIGVLITGIYDSKDYGKQAVTDAFQGGPLSDATLNVTFVQLMGGSEITWQRWDLPTAKTSVFVIQGTMTIYDALQDIAIYALSSSIELISNIFALDSILPDVFIADLIDLISNDDFSIKTHLKIQKAMKQFQFTHPKNQWTTIVAGHSLGGSYANTLAALQEIPSVTFSPPGLRHISKSLGINTEQLELAKSYILSFVPMYDTIAKFDEPVGATIQIPCSLKYNTANSMKCHSPMRTLSTLIMACPDVTFSTRRWSLAEDFFEDVNGQEESKITYYLGAPSGKEDTVKWPYKWDENVEL